MLKKFAFLTNEGYVKLFLKQIKKSCFLFKFSLLNNIYFRLRKFKTNLFFW